jgi:hypothetical protein
MLRMPRDPEFELFDRIPLTNSDTATTERVATAFADFFADRAGVIPHQSRVRTSATSLTLARPIPTGARPLEAQCWSRAGFRPELGRILLALACYAAGFAYPERLRRSRGPPRIGGIDTDAYQRAKEAGRVARDIPVNHSATFAPVLQPTLDTGTQALVVAALP